MTQEQQISELIKSIGGYKAFKPIIADVISVDEDTCVVKLSTGLEIPDVRLKTIIEASGDYFIIKPAVDSKVWLMPLNDSIEDLMVIKIDKIQSFEIKQNGLNILFDCNDEKVLIKNNQASLIDLFQDLKDLIGQITVSTGTGPSGTPLPPTIASLTTFETKFKTLLK